MSGAKHRKTKSMKAATEAAQANMASEPAHYHAQPHTEPPEQSVEDVDTAQHETPSVDTVDTVDTDSAEEIATLRQEVEAGKDRYLRLMAEFDNYKRRSSKEYERLISAANEKLILEMVGVRENFERALKSGEAGGEFAPFYEGMKLIFAKYDEVLTRNGLTPFAAAGEPFDPMIHDALMKAPNAQIPADCVAEVFERGYRLNDKVIKHARVVVSSGNA
ncbi:molecular chaperone GrpE [Fibrobacteres bacterium R8-0-B4]